jgi:hypothetical protein
MPRATFTKAEREAWPEGFRQCNSCRDLLPLEKFHKIPKGYKGRRGICWTCTQPRDLEAYRGQSTAKKLYRFAKQRATKLNLPFDITEEDITVPTHCPALGIELVHNQNSVGPNSPTLDKLVPELGYVKGNIAVISHKANLMKNNATLEELLGLVKWLSNQSLGED